MLFLLFSVCDVSPSPSIQLCEYTNDEHFSLTNQHLQTEYTSSYIILHCWGLESVQMAPVGLYVMRETRSTNNDAWLDPLGPVKYVDSVFFLSVVPIYWHVHNITFPCPVLHSSVLKMFILRCVWSGLIDFRIHFISKLFQKIMAVRCAPNICRELSTPI